MLPRMLSSYMSNAWAGGIVAFPAKATRQTWYSFISPVGEHPGDPDRSFGISLCLLDGRPVVILVGLNPGVGKIGPVVIDCLAQRWDPILHHQKPALNGPGIPHRFAFEADLADHDISFLQRPGSDPAPHCRLR